MYIHANGTPSLLHYKNPPRLTRKPQTEHTSWLVSYHGTSLIHETEAIHPAGGGTGGGGQSPPEDNGGGVHSGGDPIRVGPAAIPADTLRAAAGNPPRVCCLHLAVRPNLGHAGAAHRWLPQRPLHLPLRPPPSLHRRGGDGGGRGGVPHRLRRRPRPHVRRQSGQENPPRAIAIFVIGFWILDVANNMLQGPCRALLADLSAGNQRKTRSANAFFSFFMAVGNVLGYAAGSYSGLHHVFPFTKTKACDVYCANLKSCFFLSIALLLALATGALSYVKERQLASEKGGSGGGEEEGSSMPCFGQLFGAFRELKRPMWILLLVTCLNWIAWFPFLLFDTDWMGREVYGGTVGEGKAYDRGVRAGALGLMLNSLVLGATSLGVEPLARAVGGVKRLWGIVNFLLAICLAMTVLVTKLAEHQRHYTLLSTGHQEPLPPSAGVKGGALALFSVLGIPLAITYSIPFALASIFSSTSGAGQGLSLGVLNLAIVIPQMVVSVTSGPWDALFGGGNLPAFVVGAVAAAASGILSIILLPSPPPELAKAATAAGGGFH
ncbi:hypothetical protein Fmac_023763 [Flemingia macrophylla]|uniref:Uncharacterized protein n=1 Tax=Flemingia macrophylla TaxID=520843 RepID=A0ABD1LMF7_9FABA